jgi:hypothetical protein
MVRESPGSRCEENRHKECGVNVIASGIRPVRVERAIDAAADRLFSLRRPDGSWQDHLPSAAISTGVWIG